MTSKKPFSLFLLRIEILPWINVSSPLILFGLYYGFVATLPIGLPQILLVRTLLLGKDSNAKLVVGTSIVGQLVIILSVYYLHLYVMLVKPHAVILLVLPYMLFYWYRLLCRRLQKEKRPIMHYHFMRAKIVRKDDFQFIYEGRTLTFLDIIILSLFNPVLLPSPVLTRLAKLFTFRYSNKFLFVISSLYGWWLGGSIFPGILAKFISVLKPDSDTDNRLSYLVKILFARTSRIIYIALCLLYLGRAPVPLFDNRIYSNFEKKEVKKLSWLKKLPTILFDYRKWVRPFRYVEEDFFYFNAMTLIKTEMSQYFFDACVSDGRQRISFTSSPSLSIFERSFKENFKSFEDLRQKEWIDTENRGKDDLNNELTNRIRALDKGSSIEKVIEKKNKLCDHSNNIFLKGFDPLLNRELREGVAIPKSPCVLTDEYSLWCKLENDWQTDDDLGSGNFTGPQLREFKKEKPLFLKLINNAFDLMNVFSGIRSLRIKSIDWIEKKNEKFRNVKSFATQPDFRRNLILGSIRARRRKALLQESLQSEMHSPFFLRILKKTTFSSPGKIGINVKPTFEHPEKKIKGLISFLSKKVFAIKAVTKANRLATAERFDFQLAHWARGFFLVSQLYFRKYIVLPILIIFKTISYLLLFQTQEWAEDWNDWNKEFFIGCTYDGTEVSVNDLPFSWLRDGLQIKIINPSHLKWRDPGFETNSYSLAKKRKIDYGFLTAFGYQTYLPFGSRKKNPPFFKPLIRGLKKRWKIDILSEKITEIFNKFFPLKKKSNIYKKDLTILDTQPNKTTNNDISSFEPGNEHRTNFGISSKIIDELPIEITTKCNENFSSTIPDQFGYEARTNIEELRRDFVAPESNQIEGITEQTHSDELEININSKEKNGVYPGNEKELRSRKISIQISQIIVNFHRRSMELIEEWIFLIKILSKKMNRNFVVLLHLIWFNIQLRMGFTRDLSTIYKKIIFFISKSKTKDNKFFNKDLILSSKEMEYFKVHPNQDTGLISQAYVFHKIWQMKTMNKYYPVESLRYQISNLFIEENIEAFSNEEGILSSRKPRDLEEKDWKKWLQCFHRYNVPLRIWRKIAPQRWRDKVTEHWQIENYFSDNFDKYKSLRSYKKRIYSKLIADLKETGKLNERYKYNLLSYSYLASIEDADIERFPIWQDEKKEIAFNDRIQKIRKYILVNDRKKNEYKRIDRKKNIHLNSNLYSWLYPEILKKFNIIEMYEFLTTCDFSFIHEPKRSLLRKDKDDYAKKRLLERRESHKYIERWNLKSEKIAEKAEIAGNTTNLLNIIKFGVEGVNFRSLYEKILKNIVLFYNYTCMDGTNKIFKDLGHRLPEILYDEILMYKMISILLNFKSRFRRISDFILFNESMLRVKVIENKEKIIISDSFNIEDILPSKRRIQLGILNSLYLEENGNQGAEFNSCSGENRRNYEEPIKEDRKFNANETQIIKRFLWSSYRLEDLGCMNRFRFNTNDGSRFAMLRICMYPSKNS
uniref:Protein TIC 214 n=2 Tax=Isoetes TaxID=13838 RepID=A0A343URJ0_9TRAC|nr:Ycf1 [Isoetes cangae]YP_009515298.1 Ycf1 [Isoetes serracarajensis]AVH80042.1 Ycf1 [Isoetes cangae]AVH80125.1 Ycf1 [Isoetes cangae]AVH80208.1 Ycf1 [Isoetes serracarajensis]